MKPDFNKIIGSFNNLNDQARYGLLAGVVVLVILLDVFFLVLPQLGSIGDINKQIDKLSQDTQEVLTDRQRVGLLKKNLDEERLQLKSLSDKIRSTQEVPAILSTISSVANEYDVKIDQLIPEKDQQEALKSSAMGKYYALPVVIKARSGYHSFGRFLNKLENEDLYFIMKDFIIQNDETDPNTQLYSLTIKIILVSRNDA